MESKKVGIATVYTGYNYGSALQAFATKNILSQMGYEAEILKLSGSIVPGRDIRIKKIITVLLRSMVHSGGIKSLKNYGDSIKKTLSAESVAQFNHFTEYELQPESVTNKTLKSKAYGDEYRAFVCGSDQIWNSAVFYVDPFYYLQFAPIDKRIAFAPSFGRDFVPDYNKKKIKKYVSQIKYKSVREASGIDIIKDLTGDEAELLVDPTLVLNADEWTKYLKLKSNRQEKYLLAYFLDKPSEKAVRTVEKISKEYGLKVIGIPYTFEDMPWADNVVSAGPSQFVEYVKNASFVCTDSFHGTAFSLNYNIPFYTFERNYGNAGKQSARIQSILNLVSKTERYEPERTDDCFDISFENVNKVLDEERKKSKKYLQSILPCCKNAETEVPEKKNVNSIEKIRNCTGCGMCEVSCPFGAITVTESKEGFYRPVVDNEKCTECSLCTKVCYKFDDSYKPVEKETFECFSAVNNNKEELRTASSGGVSIELMREALKQGYYVAGVAYDAKSERAVTKIAKTTEELEQFKGSKYFQSYTVDAFKSILSDKSEQKYAIFGTPCQIYGFSKMAELKKTSDKYIFVDIFCHGCPSLKLWDKYLDYVKDKNGVTEFEKINFRSKTHGWHEYCFDFYTKEKKFSSSKYDDPFHEMFFGLDVMNEACYDCIARSTVEKTDIRIGDFWGKRHDMDTNGVSAVVIASEKGKELFDSVKDKFETEEADFDEIIGEQSYKVIHRFNSSRRKETLSQLTGNKSLTQIVKNRRKKLPLVTNLKRVIKSSLKHLPAPVYLKIKTKLR